MVTLDAVEAQGSKLYLNKLREVAKKKHLDKAGPNYLPLDLNCLTPSKTFLDYLLSLSDIKKNEYMKSHGEHPSALTQLYTQCEIAEDETGDVRTQDHVGHFQRPSWR